MTRKFVILLLSAWIAAAIQVTFAQSSTDEKAIAGVINQLFKGMELGDSAMVHRAFTGEVTMATIRRDKENKPLITRESSLSGFLKAVGTPHANKWYEEIWDLKISVDGDFAQAWCDYAFYIGKKFSHCGVDAFQLYKGENGWVIFHLADTRRSTDCSIPTEIQQKHN